ncbi:hypothetical protein BJ741DRAFT_636925 [Chytriomyces cf. hyalinus JEL632]|nr:hypothetical protein BJ741DRAFT_636925 [Chytriomyces cf. hyalinus JEL632]
MSLYVGILKHGHRPPSVFSLLDRPQDLSIANAPRRNKTADPISNTTALYNRFGLCLLDTAATFLSEARLPPVKDPPSPSVLHRDSQEKVRPSLDLGSVNPSNNKNGLVSMVNQYLPPSVRAALVAFWNYLGRFASFKFIMMATTEASTVSTSNSYSSNSFYKQTTEPQSICFSFHRHHHTGQSRQRCANLLKLESVESQLLHMRSTVDAERTARTYIGKVHAKSQVVVEQQRETIAKLEDTVESLQDEVKSLNKRLIDAMSKSSSSSIPKSRKNSGSSVRTYNDFYDYDDYDPPASKATSVFMRPPILMCQAQAEAEAAYPSDSDDSEPESEDDDDSEEDEDEEFDDDEFMNDVLACNVFADMESLDSVVDGILNMQPAALPSLQVSTPEIQTPPELQSLATQNLIQSLLKGGPASVIPTQLDVLAATLALSPYMSAKIAITSLASYATAAQLPGTAHELAKVMRSLFRKHIALLQIYCASPSSFTRLATLEGLFSYCYPGAQDSARAVWGDAFGLIVYVLVDLEILQAEDVINWWRITKSTIAEESVTSTNQVVTTVGVASESGAALMDKLVATLELASTSETSDDDEEDQDDEPNLDDTDCDESCCTGSDGEDTVVASGDVDASAAVAPNKQNIELESGTERRVSFKV